MDNSTKNALVNELKKAMLDPNQNAQEDDRVNFKNTTGTLEIHKEFEVEQKEKVMSEADKNRELEMIMERVAAQRSRQQNKE